ncbi:MAG: alpha/beta fold hydrolase [Planctomycetales bacterium]|nr:alpha/beta fold hydrolase [Planctomycetales bacterium]
MEAHTQRWNFRPHPLLRNGHLQTVAGIYLPRRDQAYAATQHFVACDPVPPSQGGDQLVLHEDRPVSWREHHPTVLLIHGFAGCYASTYMVRMAERLVQRGYCVFRMDMRGCGEGKYVARQPTHCGAYADAGTAVQFIAERYPDAPTLAVGFSLGGALALGLLADAGACRVGNLQRVLAVCPPIDLFDVERRFDQRGGRPYDKFFVKLIWKQILDRWQRYPELAPDPIPKRPKRLKQIDETVVAPAAGFAGAHDYYAGTQIGPRLIDIEQPATIIASADDPIVPTGPLLKYPRSESVEVVVVPGGGHLGFIGDTRETLDPDFRWLDWRILDWVEERDLGTRVDAAESTAVHKPHAKQNHSAAVAAGKSTE